MFFAMSRIAPALSPRALRPPGQLRISPVDSFEHIGHLSRRDRNDAFRRRWPDKLAPVEPLRIERKPKAVVPKDLRQIASAAPKNVEIASVGITLQLLLDLKRKPLHAAPHVRVARRDPDPASRGDGDHDRSAFRVAEIRAEDAPAQIRTRASFTSTTIRPGSEEGAAVGESAATASSISTGAKPEISAASALPAASDRQGSCRHPRAAQRPPRPRPGSAISAKIRARSSSLQRRRRSFPVINVIRLMLCS